jgi:alpha/beta hydrolase fold
MRASSNRHPQVEPQAKGSDCRDHASCVIGQQGLTRRDVLKALSAVTVTGLIGSSAAACVNTGSRAAVEHLGHPFVSKTAIVNGARIHYVTGGSGPALFLLHGFPQDWYAWHKVMPQLAMRFTVIAPDMRGVGGSSGPVDQYDPQTLVRDLRELAAKLGFETIAVAGHDNGRCSPMRLRLPIPSWRTPSLFLTARSRALSLGSRSRGTRCFGTSASIRPRICRNASCRAPSGLLSQLLRSPRI